MEAVAIQPGDMFLHHLDTVSLFLRLDWSTVLLVQCLYCFFSTRFFFFGHVACGILVPRPGIESVSPAVEVRTAREFLFSTCCPSWWASEFWMFLVKLSPHSSPHCSLPLLIKTHRLAPNHIWFYVSSQFLLPP